MLYNSFFTQMELLSLLPYREKDRHHKDDGYHRE